jgi:nitroreductase
MKTLDAILTRVSNPFLTDPHPSESEMSLVYQCALRAPDHAWLRPWRFIEVSGVGRDKLSNAFINSLEKKEKLSDAMKKKICLLPFRSPMIIVLIADIVNRINVPRIEQIQSVAAAA